MIKITEVQKQCFILTDGRQDANDLTDLFSPQFLQEQGLITGSAMGRGKVNIFNFKEQQYVLRHYHRGGLISKLSKDRYLWPGIKNTAIKNTRAYQEFALLLHIQQLGLPTSLPLAARVTRNGLFYSADLITAYIDNTGTLAGRLEKQQSLPWKSIGQTIALFHKQQVYHDDLNAHNILINDREQVFIIDFDKGKIAAGDSWKQANLDRLKRSLEKITAFTNDDASWQLMVESYKQALSK